MTLLHVFTAGYIPAVRSPLRSTKALDWGFLKGGIATCFFGFGGKCLSGGNFFSV